MWEAVIKSPAEIIQKTDCNNQNFASGRRAFYEQCWNREGKDFTSSSYCTSWFHVFDDRGSNFQGFKETTTTGTLLIMNGGTYPKHCICIWFIHKFMYSYAELSSSDLHSIMMTLNYCTSPIASSCHSTEPGGLWKNSQNRSRICFAEAVIELCILEFFSWVPPFASRLPQSFDEKSGNNNNVQ